VGLVGGLIGYGKGRGMGSCREISGADNPCLILDTKKPTIFIFVGGAVFGWDIFGRFF